MPTNLARAAAAAIAATALTACGSGDSDEEEVRETARTLTRHLADANPRPVCEELAETAGGRPQQIERNVEQCVADLRRFLALLSDQQRDALRDVTYGEVEIDGDRAVIEADHVRIPPELASMWEPEPVHARRVGGEWRIVAAPR